VENPIGDGLMKILYAFLLFSGSLMASDCDEFSCNLEKPNLSYFPDLRKANSFRAYYTMLSYMDKAVGPLTFVPYPSSRFDGIKDELDYLVFFDFFVDQKGRLIKRNLEDLPKSGGDDLFEDFRKGITEDFVSSITE
jgi:hypothetical protein